MVDVLRPVEIVPEEPRNRTVTVVNHPTSPIVVEYQPYVTAMAGTDIQPIPFEQKRSEKEKPWEKKFQGYAIEGVRYPQNIGPSFFEDFLVKSGWNEDEANQIRGIRLANFSNYFDRWIDHVSHYASKPVEPGLTKRQKEAIEIAKKYEGHIPLYAARAEECRNDAQNIFNEVGIPEHMYPLFKNPKLINVYVRPQEEYIAAD